MVMQFLLNPDGSIPEGTDVEALTAAGVVMVIPTPRPTPDQGMHCVEGDPVQDGEVWRQVWTQEPIPAPVPLPVEQIDALRANAYRDEADPLFFKSQRGEATQADWLAKITEIKARFPKV